VANHAATATNYESNSLRFRSFPLYNFQWISFATLRLRSLNLFTGFGEAQVLVTVRPVLRILSPLLHVTKMFILRDKDEKKGSPEKEEFIRFTAFH
jgi:hypothetical protein